MSSLSICETIVCSQHQGMHWPQRGINMVDINSLWPSDVIWHHESGSTLDQVMAWHLFSANPLPQTKLDESMIGRHLKSPRSLSGRTLHLTFQGHGQGQT